MGDLVRLPLSGLVSALELLERRGIQPEHLTRMRRHTTIADAAAEALKAPVITPSPVESISGYNRLRDLVRDDDLLIRQWEALKETSLPSRVRLQDLVLVEFGIPTCPLQAHAWMLANKIKPARIGELAVLICQKGQSISCGVIATGTRSKPERGKERYVPGFRRSGVAGKKFEIDRFALDNQLDVSVWCYLGHAEQ